MKEFITKKLENGQSIKTNNIQLKDLIIDEVISVKAYDRDGNLVMTIKEEDNN